MRATLGSGGNRTRKLTAIIGGVLQAEVAFLKVPIRESVPHVDTTDHGGALETEVAAVLQATACEVAILGTLSHHGQLCPHPCTPGLEVLHVATGPGIEAAIPQLSGVKEVLAYEEG